MMSSGWCTVLHGAISACALHYDVREKTSKHSSCRAKWAVVGAQHQGVAWTGYDVLRASARCSGPSSSTRVLMGSRPGGSSLMTDNAMSPNATCVHCSLCHGPVPPALSASAVSAGIGVRSTATGVRRTSDSVRGMGVAVMDSTCGAGLVFICSIARCSTPNLRHARLMISSIGVHAAMISQTKTATLGP